MLSSGNLRRRLLAGTCSLAAIAVLGTSSARAQDAQGEPAKYQPFGEIVAHAGSAETGIAIEGWAPLIQGDSALLFVDGRIGATDEEDYYTNLGLGVRAIVGDSVVIGGYGYFDFTRDELDRDFYGATFGAEVMTPRFELRANYYLPTTENRYLGTEIEPVGTLTIEDNELLERRDTMRFDLSSMKGVDAEAGVKLFGTEDGSQDFRVFAGGYHYWDSQLDDVDGGYGEAEYRLHNLFGEGSLLSFAGRVSDDNWRGTEVSGQVRLRIAFGKPRGPARSLTGPESRMTERVRRRGTIVSQVRETPGTQDYNVTNALNGSDFGQFFFADGGNSLGVGDPGDPTTLGDAAARADAGDYIVAEGGHGDITTTGVTLVDDVSLVGGGSTTLSVRMSGGSVQEYTLGTTAGTIANTNPANDTITLGDGNYLAGFSLTGGANAIAGSGISDVTISDVSIEGAAANGIAIADADDVSITGSTISDVGLAGIALSNIGLAVVSDSTITGGSDGAIGVTGSGTVALSDLTLASTGGNVLSIDGTGGDLYVSAFSDLVIEGGNGETGGALVTNATFDANSDTASIEAVDGGDLAIGASDGRVGGGGLVLDGVLGSVAFDDLDIYTDGGDGLYIRDGEGKVGTFAFANTSGTIDAIGGAAIDIDPVTVSSVFDSLTSTGSPGAGLIFDHVSGSFTVTGATTVTGSAGPAIKIVDSDAEFTFGAVNIVDPEGDGVVVEGVNGDIEFGDTRITGLGAATGVDVSGAQGNIVFKSLDIEGTGAAGSKGIDMSGSTNAGFIGTTNPSSIAGVDIGIDLTDAAITGTFQFGDGSDTDTNGAASLIDATTPIVATNLGITGTYNLLDAQLVGDIGGLAGDDITIFFVDTTPGAGTASDPGTIGQAELSGADIIVLVNDGLGSIDAAGSNSDDTFVLADGQQLTGFYGQTSFDYVQSGPQANLMVHGLAAGTTVTVDDPTGNGGATLVSSAGDALTVSGNNIVDHVIVGDSSGFGVAVGAISGSVEINDSDIESLSIAGGSSTVSLTNTDITAAGETALSVTAGHTGTLMIDGTSSIASSNTSGNGINFDNAAGTYTIAAPITLTGGNRMLITGSSGTFDFTGAISITGTISGSSALLLSSNEGTVNFGTVDIIDPLGRGIEISSEAGDVSFGDASINDVAGTGGFGVLIQGQDAASTITFDNLDLVRDDVSSPDSFAVSSSAGTITVTAGSFANVSSNDLIDIDGGSATISIGATLNDSGTGNGIEIDGVTGGSITFGGNYTRNGIGNAIALGQTSDNTGGTITFGGNVTVTGGANIDIAGTNSVAFNGATGVSGALFNSVDVSGTNGTVSFANLDIAMTADNTVGLDLNGATFTTGFTATDFDITSTSSTGTLGIDLRNASGIVRLGDIVASGGASASISGVATGVRADNTSNVTFTFGDGENTVDVASVIDAVTTAIDFTGNDGSVGTFNFVDVDWTLASNSLSYQNLLSEFTVYYIDAEGDGNGSAANPGSFDDAGALAADVLILVNQNGSGTDTINLADGAQGSINSFQLQDGQGLFSFNGGETIDLAPYGYSMGGAPTNFSFTAVSGVGTIIDNPGDGAGAPILTTTAGGTNTLTIAAGGHVVIGGVIVDSGDNFGMYVNSAASLWVDESDLRGFDGGLNIDLANSGAATTGVYTISDSTFAGTAGNAFYLRSGAGDNATLTITDSEFDALYNGIYATTYQGGIAQVSLSGITSQGGDRGVLIERDTTGGAMTITALDDITVTGAGISGIEIRGNNGSHEVTFDADPLTAGLQEVAAGNIHLGTSGSPLAGAGLSIANVAGSLTIADLQAHTQSVTAVYVDNALLEASQPSLGFALSTLDGDISLAGGTAGYYGLFLRAIDADMVLDTVSVVGGDYGVSLETVTGIGTASNALTIADLTIDGSLTGGVVLNAVNGAVTITDGAIGAIDDPAGRAVYITGGTGNVSIGADVTKTSVGNVVEVRNRATGTVTFSGAISASGGFGNGISIHDNTGGTINFTGPVTLNGTGNPVSLFQNTGATINFSGALDVTSSTAAAFAATNGGTVTVNSTGVATSLTSTAGGSALVLSGIIIGDSGITFDTVNVTNGGLGDGILVSNVSQTLTSTGLDILDGSIAVNQGTGRAVEITNSSADIYIGADISSSGTAIRSIEVTGNGRAGGQTIEFAGLIDENMNGLVFDNNDQNGGYSNIVLSGTVDIDTVGGAGAALSFTNGGNLSVTGQMSIDTQASTTGLYLFQNAGYAVTINSAGNGLDINTVNGLGIQSSQGGTLQILGSGNSITTSNGALASFSSDVFGAGGVNFATLTATLEAQTTAIYLNNVSGGAFNGGAISIATMTGADAISVNNSSVDVTFASIDIGAGSGYGVYWGNNSGDLTVTGTTEIDGATSAGIYIWGNTGLVDFGATTISGVPGATYGLRLGGTIGGAITFDSLDIALNGINAIGLYLNSAVINADVTITDFDVTSTSASGTIGVELQGANGTGTVQLGDSDVNGESATIAGVETGVILSDTSDINFIFGDGEGTTDVGSSITALTAIDFTDATGANGLFNFLDVTFPTPGSTDNLENAFDVYWIDEDADGSGSMANPGGFNDVGAANADVIVLVNSDSVANDTIDLAGSNQGSINSYTVSDGQVIVSFNGGDEIDLTDYGFSGGGAPANIQLTGIVSGGTTLTNPFTGFVPTVTTSAAGQSTFVLGTGTYWFDGVVIGASTGNLAGIYGNVFDALTIRNSSISGDAFGLHAWYSMDAAATTSTITVTDSSFTGDVSALLAIGGTGDDITVDITDASFGGTFGGLAALYLTAEGGTLATALNGITVDGDGAVGIFLGNSGPGDHFVTEFSGITVTGNGTAAVQVTGYDGLNEVTFDADPGTAGIQAVNGGDLTIGAPGTPFTGNGLDLTNVAGSLSFGDLDIETTGGGGLYVDNAQLKAQQPALNFTLSSTSGTINSVNAPALYLDPLTVNMVLDSVSASGGAYGIYIDEVAGTLDILGGAITGTTTTSVRLTNSTLDFSYAGTLSNASGNTVSIDNQHAGTVTFSGAIDENGNGIYLSTNTGGTIRFTGGLDIDNLTNTIGFQASSGGTIVVTGTNTIDTSGTGRLVFIDGVSAGTGGINFTSLTTTGSATNSPIYINNLDGTSFSGGTVNIAGVAGANQNGIYILGGSAATMNFGATTIGGASSVSGDGIRIADANNGTITFDSVNINNTTGDGVEIFNATGAVNINGGSIGATNDPAGRGVFVNGGTGTVSIAASITKSSSGEPVLVDNHETGTVTFSGDITSSGSTSALSVTNVNSGTVNFTGQTISLNPVGDNGVFLNANTGGTINFNPTAGGNGLDIVTTSGYGFYATGGGTITVTGSGNTIQTATGPIIYLDGVSAGTGGINWLSLTSTSATVAGFTPIYLNNLDGTSFSGGTVNIVGTGAGIDGIYIGGGSAATIDFGSTTIGGANSIGGDGIEISGAGNGTVTFSSVTINNTLGHGVYLNGSGGTVNINGGSIGASNDPSGRGVYINGGTGDVSIAASITKTSAGKVVEIDNHETGTITFSGGISASGGVDNGILVQNVNSGTINFTGTSINLSTGANTAVNLLNNSGGTINFNTGLGLMITTTSGTGFSANNSGTITVTGPFSQITSATGALLFISDTAAGTGGVRWNQLTGSGTLTGNGVYLYNFDGTLLDIGTLSIAGTIAGVDGVYIGGGSAAAMNFLSATIGGASSIGGDGIEIDGAGNGTVTFGSVSINNVANNGVAILNATGAVNINGGNIGNTNDPAGRGVYINGGTGDVSIAASITKTSAGKVVEIDNYETGTITFSGNISASGGVDNGILIQNVNSGTINFTGQTISITTGTNAGTAVRLADNAGGTINFNPVAGGNGLDLVADGAYGMYAYGGGTISVTGTGNSVQTATGSILNLQGVSAGTGGINFASLTGTGTITSVAIYLNDLDGTSFNGGTVNIAGTSGGTSYGIFIGGNSAATFDFGTATVSNTGSDGIHINGAGNGAVTFASVNINNTTGDGIEINGADGDVTINGGSIGGSNDPTGRGVYVNGGTGNVSIAASVTKTTAGKVIEVSNHETGTVTFSGNISATGAVDNGISVANSNSGTINFTGQTINLSTGANTAVNLQTNSGGTINFNPTAGGNGLDIATTSGTGFYATGGTLSITGTGNTITTATGQIIYLDGVSAGTGGINWASLTSTGTVANFAIRLNNLDGTTFDGGTVSIAGTSGALNDGILIGGGSAANITFGTTTIGATGDEGIEIASGGNGTITFGATTITGAAGNGIEIGGGNTGDITFSSLTIDGTGGIGIYLNNIGTTNFTVSGGAIGATNDPAGAGVSIVGGSGTVSIAANITKTSAGNVVSVQNRTGGTVTFSGNISASGGAGGISLSGNAGDIVFSGSSKVLNTGVSNGVTINNNTANIDFTGGGLVITTTSGMGLSAGTTSTATGGTLTVSGTGNIINTGSGSAFVLNGTDSDGITFQSISKNGGLSTAIFIKDAGTGGFTVTGLGSTTNSGGIISGPGGFDGETATGIGAYIENTSNIALNNMTFTGAIGNYAILGVNVVNFTLRDSMINGTSGTTAGEAAIYFHNLTGLAIFEGNAISGGYSDNLRILNDSATGTLNLYIRDSANDAAIFGSNGTTVDGNDAVNVEVSGDNNLFMLVDGVQFTAWRGDAIQVTTNGTANSEITIQNSTFANAHANIASGGGIGVLLTGTSNGAGWGVDYTIQDNTFTGSKGYAVAASFFGAYDGVIRGFIDGNTIGTAGGGYTGSGSSEAGGILVKVERNGLGSGNLTQYVTISNNNIYDVAQMGINVTASSGTGPSTNAIIEATITNNIVSEMSNAPNVPYAALYMLAGGNDPDFGIVRANVTGNVFNMSGTSGAYAPIFLDQIFMTDAQYQFAGYTSDIDTFLNSLNTITQGAAQSGGAVNVFAPDADITGGTLQPAQTGSNTSLPTGG